MHANFSLIWGIRRLFHRQTLYFNHWLGFVDKKSFTTCLLYMSLPTDMVTFQAFSYTLAVSMVTWHRSSQSLSHSPAGWSGAACTAWTHIVTQEESMRGFTDRNDVNVSRADLRPHLESRVWIHTSYLARYTPTIQKWSMQNKWWRHKRRNWGAFWTGSRSGRRIHVWLRQRYHKQKIVFINLLFNYLSEIIWSFLSTFEPSFPR